jgi:hypothetical protein
MLFSSSNRDSLYSVSRSRATMVVLLTAQHTTCQSSCHIVSHNYIHSVYNCEFSTYFRVYNCEFSTYFRVDHMLNFLNLGSSSVQIYNLGLLDR